MLAPLRRVVKPFVFRAVHRKNERLRVELAAAGRALGPRDWGAEVDPRGELTLGGCRLGELAETFGTPLHVVHEDRLAGNFQRVVEGFRRRLPRVDVGFSYKTNPLAGAIRILHRAGALAEVISHFELWLALRLGVPGERIVFNGPGKSVESLRLAVERGVRMINLDNIDEADTIQRYAAKSGRRQDVGVRVVTSVGWSAQFGLSLESGAALAAFDKIRSLDRLVPRGLHVHLGTGIKNVSVYAQAVDELFAFAGMLKRTRGIAIDFFDLGGGFGVPTVASYSDMDVRLLDNGLPSSPVDPAATPEISVYADTIADLVKKHFGTESPTIFFEPGRAISSSAQVLLLRVMAIKPGPRGTSNIILDGGHNLAIPTSYERHEILPVRRLNEPADTACSFFGPLCHPGDVLMRYVPMPKLGVGDVVAVMDAGAYFIPNQMNFSNPRPAAVIAKDGRAHLTRAAETFENMVSLDLPSDDEQVRHG